MLVRLFVAAFSVVLFAGSFIDRSEAAGQSACVGLSQADCTANPQCFWKAEKTKCKDKDKKKSDSDASTPSASPPSDGPKTPPESPQ